MPSTPNGNEQIMVACECDCTLHICNAGTLRNQRGLLVNHAIPDLANRVVALIGWQIELAVQFVSEFPDSGRLERR